MAYYFEIALNSLLKHWAISADCLRKYFKFQYIWDYLIGIVWKSPLHHKYHYLIALMYNFMSICIQIIRKFFNYYTYQYSTLLEIKYLTPNHKLLDLYKHGHYKYETIINYIYHLKAFLLSILRSINSHSKCRIDKSIRGHYNLDYKIILITIFEAVVFYPSI